MQISRRTEYAVADKQQAAHMQLALALVAIVIQSRVTTRLVVWLHNPICQAIGHRRAGGGSCNPYGLLPLPRYCGEGRKPGSRNSADFQGRDSASDPKDDPGVWHS